MKKPKLIVAVAVLCLSVGATVTNGQNTTEREQGPDRIMNMLTEKERGYAEGKAGSSDLSEEEMEHVKRIVRLHQLESEKDVEFEAAGAEPASGRRVEIAQAVDADSIAIEDIEMQQQENTSVLLREMARLRAEVLRLNARVQVLEMEMDGTIDPLEEDAVPEFYVPVR